MNNPAKTALEITHFSDVLCVWAYISQVRVSELESNFPGQLHFDYRFLRVFGDVPGKIATQWAGRGGVAAYADHVQEVAGQFEHIELHADVWRSNTPSSSLPAHLLLCAVRRIESDSGADEHVGLTKRVLLALRHAFFVNLVDISRRTELLAVAEEAGAPIAVVEQLLNNGIAYSVLAADLAAAAEQSVRTSPTIIFNEGRQVMAGNVGYRVLESNVRELLLNLVDQHSWC